MSITGVSGTSQTSALSTAAASTSQTVSKDDFLQMLVAQIKTQDPLNPMDGTEFAAQLAQFSSVEQLYNINTNLTALQTAQAAATNNQAIGYIGKTILANGDSVTLGQTGSADLAFSLGSAAAAVGARIYRPNGTLVRTISADALSDGTHTLSWDGKDGNGNRVDAGQYSFEILAVDNIGQTVTAATYQTGKVTGVTMASGSAALLLGDDQVALSDVVRVTEPVAQTTTE